MPYYVVRGTVPPKKHTVHKQADGSLAYEEMIGEEGFSGSASMLYHRRVPSAMIDSRPWDLGDLKTQPNYPLRPLHLRLGDLFPGEAYVGKDPVRHRRLVLGNGDVRINYVVADTVSPLYSNATGDECVYVQSGRARLESVFGQLEVGAGDYVILPRTTIHRWVPLGVDEHGPLRFFCIEASSHIVHPRRHLSKYGQFLAGSPLTERDLRVVDGPSLAPHPEQEEPVDVYVKHRGRAAHGIVGSVVTHATHPFDVEGWDGYVYPYAFSVHDFEPVTGSIHQPPPAHQVLEGYNFVDLQLRPAPAGLPPGRHPAAVLPLERRLRRGAVLLRRRLHGPQGHRHRRRIGDPAPVGPLARPAGPRVRERPRRDRDRRARRDDRHLPSAGDRRGRHGQRRRPVRVVLERRGPRRPHRAGAVVIDGRAAKHRRHSPCRRVF